VTTNLIAQLMDDLSGEPLARVATAIGETQASTGTALGAAVPAIMSALAIKGATPAGASELVDMIRRNKLDVRQYAETSNTVAAANGVSSLMSAGRSVLDDVFGGRTASVADWLSSYAAINRSSARSLLTICVPLVIGRITQSLISSGLTAGSLRNLLVDQRAFLKDKPKGLAAALGIGAVGQAPLAGAHEGARAAPALAAWAKDMESRGATGRWKWVLPLLLLALIPLFLVLRRQAPREMAVQAPAPRPEVATSGAAAPSPATAGDLVDMSLPGGVLIRVPSLGVESKLITFIEDPKLTPDRGTWLTFDRLEFETDSALLKPSSQEQLRDVAEILKAYPNVNVKIGGYTDNAGDDAYNLTLSADRADNTLKEIANLGVDRSRLESEGYGENHPIADNATAEGRQRNRRIDIRVTKK